MAYTTMTSESNTSPIFDSKCNIKIYCQNWYFASLSCWRGRQKIFSCAGASRLPTLQIIFSDGKLLGKDSHVLVSRFFASWIFWRTASCIRSAHIRYEHISTFHAVFSCLCLVNPPAPCSGNLLAGHPPSSRAFFRPTVWRLSTPSSFFTNSTCLHVYSTGSRWNLCFVCLVVLLLLPADTHWERLIQSLIAKCQLVKPSLV